ISAGQPSDDQNSTHTAQFKYDGTNGSTVGADIVAGGTDAIGRPTSRLDDVAWYGNTHDVRDQTSGTGVVAGSQFVSFYAVNAMGGSAGATLLASAAKFGGFDNGKGSKMLPDGNSTAQTC